MTTVCCVSLWWEWWAWLPPPASVPALSLLSLPRALLPLVSHPGPSVHLSVHEAEPSVPGRCSQVSEEAFVCVAIPRLLACS